MGGFLSFVLGMVAGFFGSWGLYELGRRAYAWLKKRS
jgi:hypothetical protein